MTFDSTTGAIITGQPAQGESVTTALYGGIEATVTLAGGLAGVSFNVGIAEIDGAITPLSIYLSGGGTPGIPIGDTGLFITSLGGGVEFGASFPTITSATQLESSAFSSIGTLPTGTTWQQELIQQTINITLHSPNGTPPSFNDFGAAGMIIEASIQPGFPI